MGGADGGDPPMADGGVGGAVPPIHFFYTVHLHSGGDQYPYMSDRLEVIDTGVADNMIATVEGMAEVMNRYGVRATWQPVYGSARGFCEHEGRDDHVYRRLLAAGHDIGLHAHQLEDMAPTYRHLVDSCGITPTSFSGFVVQIQGDPRMGSDPQVLMAQSLQAGAELGLGIGTSNMSPGGMRNPLPELCGNELGDGNDMWESTGNLMFPWAPDVPNENVCDNDPTGSVILADHSPPEWTIVDGRPSNVLSDEAFDQLQVFFDGAIAYMEEARPTRTAVWGLITHITEYTVGTGGRNGPNEAALAALDRFLAYVDEKRQEGRVIYSNVTEIGELIAAERAGR